MKTKNLLFTLAGGVIMLSLAAGSAHAAGSKCQVMYGGGQVCDKNVEFSLDKLVRDPNSSKGGSNFVDSLNATGSKYTPGQNVEFKIVIKNTGDTKIDKIDVLDTLPQYLTFVSGEGNYDANSRKLTFSVTNLDAGKTVEYIITTKVVDENLLPADQGTVCVTNQVRAVETNSATAEDTAQVCIQKNVQGGKTTPKVFDTPKVTKTPETGPELLALVGLIPAGAAGVFLRRKAK